MTAEPQFVQAPLLDSAHANARTRRRAPDDLGIAPQKAVGHDGRQTIYMGNMVDPGLRRHERGIHGVSSRNRSTGGRLSSPPQRLRRARIECALHLDADGGPAQAIQQDTVDHPSVGINCLQACLTVLVMCEFRGCMCCTLQYQHRTSANSNRPSGATRSGPCTATAISPETRSFTEFSRISRESVIGRRAASCPRRRKSDACTVQDPDRQTDFAG